MKVIKEHNCRCDDNNFTAVQKLKHAGGTRWYLVYYDNGINQAFGIVYCPYCGARLAESEENNEN